MTVNERIKTELRNNGRTQAWLTRKINESGIAINKQRLCDVLNGKRILTADEFIVICKILELTIDSFDFQKGDVSYHV